MHDWPLELDKLILIKINTLFIFSFHIILFSLFLVCMGEKVPEDDYDQTEGEDLKGPPDKPTKGVRLSGRISS